MYNRWIEPHTAKDIDKRVAKVLKDLGSPEPPLRLELVRELLRLDLAFYSKADTGILAETVHRLRVAGKQVLSRPALLVDAVLKFDLKALWVPDRKRILLDSDLPSKKQRWGEAHEVGHSLLPWHETVMHGDRKHTLTLSCEQQIEAEANFAAGRLLFLQGQFDEHLLGSDFRMNSIRKLSEIFENTITSTLWRAVESSDAIAFGLVSQHPHHELKTKPIRYFIRSAKFFDQFGQVSSIEVFQLLKSFCSRGRGPIGEAELRLGDVNGNQHSFFVEVFFNHYEALTLGVHRKICPKGIQV